MKKMSLASRRGRTKRALAILGIAQICLLLAVSALAAGCGGKSTTDTAYGGGRGDGGEPAARLTWPFIYRDPSHTGRSNVNGPASANLKWTGTANSDTWSWAVLGKDEDLICGFADRVISVDPESGGIDWEYPTGGERATSCCVAGDGTIYCGVGSRVVALYPEGSQKWSYEIGGTVDMPAVDLDGTVYAGSTAGKLVALTATGELKWEAAVPGNICTPTAAKDALYCGASPLVLYAFDKEGNKLWEVRPEGDLPLYEGLSDWANTLDYPSIGDDGTLYVGSFPYPGITSAGQMIPSYAIPTMGKLYAISPRGELLWRFDPPYRESSYFNIHTPSIGKDGTLYAGTSLWRVLAISPRGELLWEFNTGEGADVCPTVYSPTIGGDGLLYAATTSGKMICINPDGKEIWRFDSGKPWLPGMSRSNNLTPPPMGKDGTLFTVQADGTIYAFK
ncbi:MAG: PQQ-binding-like beta-propeller repeat protein [Actinomycetota bacterium]|nr:PQQ-binding-like beta-propeller repeat protein [Actinomycetota bacterium]